MSYEYYYCMHASEIDVVQLDVMHICCRKIQRDETLPFKNLSFTVCLTCLRIIWV